MLSQRIYVYFISTLKNSTLPVRAGNVIYHKQNSKNKTNITLPSFAAMFYRKILMISLVKSLTINQRNFVAVIFYKKRWDKSIWSTKFVICSSNNLCPSASVFNLIFVSRFLSQSFRNKSWLRHHISLVLPDRYLQFYAICRLRRSTFG